MKRGGTFCRLEELSPEEQQWLRDFDRCETGRAAKAVYDRLGFSVEARRDRYRTRQQRRTSVAYRIGTERVFLTEARERPGDDPMDALVELVDRRRAG
jgi:ribosomal protein S18 acetylase RimI-like enzyme